MRYDFPDTPLLHVICATICSGAAAIVGCPPDVMKTRTMNLRTDREKTNYFVLAKQIYQNEGLSAFYKGVDGLFWRLALWNSLMFIILEQIKFGFYDPTLD